MEALLKQMEQIRLGQAEPPPIALPEDYEDEEDDLSDDEDGPPSARGIGSVDLGFFGGQRPQQPEREGGRRRQQQQQGGRPGPATQATAGKRQERQQQQQQQQEDDGDLLDLGGEELEGEELNDEEVEKMLQMFRKQRDLEAKGRASRAKGQ